MTAGPRTATRPGATAATSSRARSASVPDSPTRLVATIRGAKPDWRTGRGGAMAGAATASTCAASATTSAGVR